MASLGPHTLQSEPKLAEQGSKLQRGPLQSPSCALARLCTPNRTSLVTSFRICIDFFSHLDEQVSELRRALFGRWTCQIIPAESPLHGPIDSHLALVSFGSRRQTGRGWLCGQSRKGWKSESIQPWNTVHPTTLTRRCSCGKWLPWELDQTSDRSTIT